MELRLVEVRPVGLEGVGTIIYEQIKKEVNYDMEKVISKDGTEIAYDKQGNGPTVVLIDGALGFRSFGPMPELAKKLSQHFTVITYDRRGRGDSGDNKPFSVKKEIEDIEALIDETGESAYLYGISSGACLALEVTIGLGHKVKKLAMYEPPYKNGEAARQEWKQYTKQLMEFLATDRRGDAVTLFMKFVGVPSEQIESMCQAPMWKILESVSPTLLYEASAMGVDDRSIPVKRASAITAQTLVMHGGAGEPFMKDTAFELSRAIPNAQFRTLEGQTHDVSTDIVAPVLAEFFK